MKKIFLPIAVPIVIGITAFTITSCGGEEKNELKGEYSEQPTKEETCFYSYDKTATTQVRWTAFKTSEKKPVGGQFDQVNVTAGDKSTKITDILETIKFNIPTSSTNTTNEDRDAKIVKSFFGAMNATDIILGQVKSATGDNTLGTCIFYLTINNIEKEVTLDYVVEGATIKLTGEIDLINFSAEAAVESLNQVCGDLHTGEDGITKTWSVVELAIETTLKKECH
jgi:polyisoprenoid-binding protein YceI